MSEAPHENSFYTDNMSLYLHDIGKMPLLTAEQESFYGYIVKGGLMNAVEKFDPERGNKLDTYCK